MCFNYVVLRRCSGCGPELHPDVSPNIRDCPNFVPVLVVEPPLKIPSIIMGRLKDVNEHSNMSGTCGPIPSVEGQP